MTLQSRQEQEAHRRVLSTEESVSGDPRNKEKDKGNPRRRDEGSLTGERRDEGSLTGESKWATAPGRNAEARHVPGGEWLLQVCDRLRYQFQDGAQG
ncbi:hypothetical protein NDU88_005437 [Pleurodeles waltl]|uniref:Uncharacterized protein n=1 Tax=Pleurodeles waltl TaxID=8319 RepID=A0AAV7WV76_PLEWA|nr:hypothetical protein NDU88_005437 [Pleurodeles waltl]